jgi:hypothetical protein
MSLDALTDQLDDLKQRRALWADLLAQPGWRQLQRDGEGQINGLRTLDYSTPINGLDAAFQSAALRREIATWQTLLNWPQLMIKDLDYRISQAHTEISEQQALGTELDANEAP